MDTFKVGGVAARYGWESIGPCQSLVGVPDLGDADMTKFVLVHGAWHGGWCWDLLVDELGKRGQRTVAPDLPYEDPTATYDIHRGNHRGDFGSGRPSAGRPLRGSVDDRVPYAVL